MQKLQRLQLAVQLKFDVGKLGEGFALGRRDGDTRRVLDDIGRCRCRRLVPAFEARRASLLGSLPPFRTPEGVEMPR